MKGGEHALFYPRKYLYHLLKFLLLLFEASNNICIICMVTNVTLLLRYIYYDGIITYILLANIIVVSYSDTSCMIEYLELLVLHACYFKYSEILLASESDTFAPPKVEGVV